MSSISVSQSSGPGIVSAAKPTADATKQAPTNRSADSSPSVLNAPVPNYPSPKFTIDPVLNTVVIEYRDASTGQATQQVPSKAQLRLYALNQASTAVQPAAAAPHGAARGSAAQPSAPAPDGAGALAAAQPTAPAPHGSAAAPAGQPSAPASHAAVVGAA